MKKTILSLIVAGVAGLLVPASAQPPAPDDSNTNQAAADQTGQPAPPADAPDAGAAPPADAAMDNAAPEPTGPTESAIVTPSRNFGEGQGVVQSAFLPPEQSGGTGAADDLTLHFNQAPLDMVLNYLSDSAGFIVVQEARINSNIRVTVNGKHLTRDEATDLLNSVLNENGLAAIRDDRTLTIVDKTDAKTREIPVKTGNAPDKIPRNRCNGTGVTPSS